jgi:thioredoxin 1
MALCCIGGVCVPYSALIPLLIYGIKWLLTKLSDSGIIPNKWVEKIDSVLQMRLQSSKTTPQDETSTRSDISTATSSCCKNESCSINSKQKPGGGVTTINSMEQWDSLFSTDESVFVICKFTASWCGPCKVIQPFYESLAAEHTNVKFCLVDVDNDSTESIGLSAGVAILPTFGLFKTSRKVETTYIGSDKAKLLHLVESVTKQETKKLI